MHWLTATRNQEDRKLSDTIRGGQPQAQSREGEGKAWIWSSKGKISNAKLHEGRDMFILLAVDPRALKIPSCICFLGICNKFPQTGWLKTTEIHSVTILEARKSEINVLAGPRAP